MPEPLLVANQKPGYASRLESEWALPWWLSGAAIATGLIVTAFLQQRSSVKKTVAMLYDLDPE